jgi:uncharacterized protein (TIGR03435 family)
VLLGSGVILGVFLTGLARRRRTRSRRVPPPCSTPRRSRSAPRPATGRSSAASRAGVSRRRTPRCARSSNTPTSCIGFQLAGSLTPIDGARWDITATLGATAAPDAIVPAVRALLADRFGLSVHRETRTLQVYALRTARSDGTPGPRLTKSALDCPALMAAARRGGGPPPPEARQCGFRGRVGSLQSSGMPITELALALSGRVGRAVVDQTGLTGPWDLMLTYAPTALRFPGTLAPNAPLPRRIPTRRRCSRLSRSSWDFGSCLRPLPSTCSWLIGCRVQRQTEPAPAARPAGTSTRDRYRGG